jgi:cbb3-type cytochrome oxidase maturation protein
MSVLLILILASLGLALLFLGAFIWAVRSNQFEDTCTPSLRVLMDDPESTNSNSPATLSTPATKSKTQ